MPSLSDLPLRDDLRGLTPYGAPQKHVRYALNVNENTHPIPEPVAHDIVASLAHAVLTANRYPDREFTVLREALAGYLGHGDNVPDAMARFAHSYADQNEADHARLVKAVQRGELPIEPGAAVGSSFRP